LIYLRITTPLTNTPLSENGNIRIELKIDKALTDPLTCLLDLEYDRSIRINYETSQSISKKMNTVQIYCALHKLLPFLTSTRAFLGRKSSVWNYNKRQQGLTSKIYSQYSCLPPSWTEDTHLNNLSGYLIHQKALPLKDKCDGGGSGLRCSERVT
jgi:hypothetical protein